MKIQKILKWYLLVTSIYLIADGLGHIFDIKLMDAGDWSVPALTYARLINHLFGTFAILAGLFGIEASRDLNKYRNFLYIAGVWSLGYGAYLVYLGLGVDFAGIFAGSPSVYAWMPFYNFYLIFEGGLLFTLSALIYLFKREVK